MAWREQIKTAASFRGVGFQTVDADQRVGRRTVLHEYPQRDQPFTEDMGRRARQYVVEAYVLGEDYLQRRDALIRAIEEPGPGQLVHPRWGVLQVAVQDYVSVKESHREGGMARFSITFVEHGDNRFPKSLDDTISQVDLSAGALDAAAADDFASLFSVDGPGLLADQSLADIQKDLNRYLGMVRQVMATGDLVTLVGSVTGISGTLSALLRTPLVLAQSVVGLGVQLTNAVKRPLSAMAELETQFAGNKRPTSTALAGSTRARLIANERARADLQRRTALTGQARTLAVALTDLNGIATSQAGASAAVQAGQAGTETAARAGQAGAVTVTATQARQLRDRLLVQIDDELELNDPPAPVARALAVMRAAVARDVQQRAELLREASIFTPVAVLPSVVLAHRIYQDAERADELVARNAVRHPAFVPAAPLEVLR